MDIVAVGTVALDSIETPFGARDGVLGGSATYLTMAARYFVDEVGLVAVVGRDFPTPYMERLRDSGVDLLGLTTDEDGDTFAWKGRYRYDLNDRDTLATDLNVLATFDPVLPPAYQKARIVCLGNLDPAIQQRVLDQVEAPEFVILDTMNFWIDHTPEALVEALGRVDCLIINDAEARQLADEPNLIRAASQIRAMGPDVLVIKKGEHGALLFTEETVFSAPAYPLEDIEDPTGAGDTFAGGFAGYLASVGTYNVDGLKRAVVFGSAMASFCVQRFGPEHLQDLTEEAIRDRVEAFRALSAVPELVLP
ncbi:MAG: PfkB family carbohydrate kinase [Bacteroidota bacterium]